MVLPIISSSSTSPLWKKILRQNFTKLEPLAQFLELNQQQIQLLLSKPKFIINVPLRLANKMAKGTLDDPLLKQFLPLKKELEVHSEFILDPVNDGCFRKSSKLLHKYEGRVLLTCTSACAMHCRYCFRQHFDYETQDKTFREEIELIKQDSSIHEVILSGGDPLSLSDEILENLLLQIDEIDHIKRIRFHTRFPIGIPERIDTKFLSVIKNIRKQIWFVIHINHARELDVDILNSFKELQRLGCVLLSQSVLLKGINDDVETLKQLCEQLVDNGIIPYYLHQLDRVLGSSHFEVEKDQGKFLIQAIAQSLPGYAVPKYVQEIAGEPNKTSLV